MITITITQLILFGIWLVVGEVIGGIVAQHYYDLWKERRDARNYRQ